MLFISYVDLYIGMIILVYIHINIYIYIYIYNIYILSGLIYRCCAGYISGSKCALLAI